MEKKNPLESKFVVKQIILIQPTIYWICVRLSLNSPKSAWGQTDPLLVFMPLCYSASRPSLVSRRVLLSSLQVSLFFLKVLVFHWSRHCCRVFDVSRGDGSEFSPVSFHGSPKVDFESVSVKLGLIATTGATHYTHTLGKKKKRNTRCISWQSRRGCWRPMKSNRFSWRSRQFDMTAEAICLGFLFYFLWRKRDKQGIPNVVSGIGKSCSSRSMSDS